MKDKKLKQKDLPRFRDELLKQQRGKCALCKQPLCSAEANLDHCFPDNVDVLTEEGFMPFYDANRLELKVAQWDNGIIDFVYPTDYIERYYDSEDYYDGDIMHLSKKSFSVECTPEHNVVLVDKTSGDAQYMPTEDYFKEGVCHKRDKVIPKTGYYHGGNGIALTDDEIRLYVAFHADGCFCTGARFRLRKKRKIKRLKGLLASCDIPYTVHNTDAFQAYIGVKDTPWYFTKRFNIPLKNFTAHQLKVFVDELVFWDGSQLGNSVQYSTTSQEDLDYVRMATILVGKRGTTWVRNGTEVRSSLYYLSFTEEDKSDSVRNIVTTRKSYKGFVRCFSVPSGALIIRHEGNVCVYGNCHTTGRNRAAVHRECNILLGKIENYIKRYGKRLREDSNMLKGFLKNVFEYMNKDYSHLPYHPKHKLPEDKKIRELQRRLKNARKQTTKDRLNKQIRELRGAKQKGPRNS